MQKEIVIVGLNHRSAPVEVRESVAFESDYLHDALTRLHKYPSIDEGVILSTCNRVEVVAAASDSATAYKEIGRFLTEQNPHRHAIALAEHTYQYRGADAVRHLFRVAASLDSMVVGEPQILGQLKEHYDTAQQAGSVGMILHRLFHRSFSVAKRVRSETGIGSGAVSVSSVAVDLAKQIFDRFDDKTVMLIGAGKMGDLMARHLQRHGVRSLMVTNRTFERAVELAERIHGNPIRFEDFPQYLKMADLVIGCTGAPEVLVDAAQVEKVLRERKHKAMFFIDIGDRRNFDGKINDLDNVYLYNIDDLRNVAEENLQGRSNEAAKAESIVGEEVESFVRWIGSLEQVPTITALRQRFDAIRRGEIEKSLNGGLKNLSPEQRLALEDMTTAMINKLLHAPIAQLKRHGDDDNDDDAALYIAALKKLFDLEGKMNRVRIGSRGSTLALAQSTWVKQQIETHYPDLRVELSIIKTSGDRFVDRPIAAVGGKGVFTKEIEDALLNQTIDLAVHSMKDLPTELPDGLAIVAVPAREDARDVLVTNNGLKLADLARGARVATGSLRRQAQLLHHRDDLVVTPIRGNVDTRLRKLDDSEADGLIMAAAGLKRIGRAERISEFLPDEICLSAVAQGALAIEARDDGALRDVLSFLHDAASAAETLAERALLRRLSGGCHVPIGARARAAGSGLEMAAIVASPDGARLCKAKLAGHCHEAESLGERLAEALRRQGADKILAAS